MKGCGLQPPGSPSPDRQFLAAQWGKKPAHAVGWHTLPSHAGGEPILPEKSFFFHLLCVAQAPERGCVAGTDPAFCVPTPKAGDFFPFCAARSSNDFLSPSGIWLGSRRAPRSPQPPAREAGPWEGASPEPGSRSPACTAACRRREMDASTMS